MRDRSRWIPTGACLVAMTAWTFNWPLVVFKKRVLGLVVLMTPVDEEFNVCRDIADVRTGVSALNGGRVLDPC